MLIVCFSDLYGVNHKNLVKTYADGTWNSWEYEISHLERSSDKSIESKLDLINLYFGFTGHLMANSYYDEALSYINKAESLINSILKIQSNNVSAISYKGIFLGYKGGINRFKYFGSAMEGLALIYKAYEKDKNNLIANINMASALYFLPAIFGGNKTEALKLLNRSLKILENQQNTYDNWMYYYVLIFIGQCNEKAGNYFEAKNTYEKVLSLQPEFRWVKNELYPGTLKYTK